LRTITEQLEAHSNSVWLRNEDTGLVSFEFAFEEGKLLTKSDAAVAKISPTLRIETLRPGRKYSGLVNPVWLRIFEKDLHFPWRDHVMALGVITILTVPLLIAGDVAGVIGISFTRKTLFSR